MRGHRTAARLGLLFFVLAILLMAVDDDEMREFGEPVDDNMDGYIIDHVQTQTGVNNAVTAVVFDYRGVDTLGEATVLFTAVYGVLVVLRRLRSEVPIRSDFDSRKAKGMAAARRGEDGTDPVREKDTAEAVDEETALDESTPEPFKTDIWTTGEEVDA